MGAYHTLDVEQNRKFIITKAKWDSISLERVDTACDPAQVNNFLKEWSHLVCCAVTSVFLER